MRKSRFTEEQIAGVLKEAEAGLKVETLCRKHASVSTPTIPGKRNNGGLELGDARRLKSLEDESRCLKTVVADLTLDIQMLKAWCSGQGDARCTPSGGGWLQDGFGVSQRRSCRVLDVCARRFSTARAARTIPRCGRSS